MLLLKSKQCSIGIMFEAKCHSITEDVATVQHGHWLAEATIEGNDLRKIAVLPCTLYVQEVCCDDDSFLVAFKERTEYSVYLAESVETLGNLIEVNTVAGTYLLGYHLELDEECTYYLVVTNHSLTLVGV